MGILADVRRDHDVIQDFRPLADSIEWHLGQSYWQARGARAFLSDADAVPYLPNNDGIRSRKAAEVLFASLVAAHEAGTLPNQVVTLELGIGVGLFARYFLDAFRVLCARHNTDYYNRLCYIAGDCSESMLRDACRNGVFANHPGRYVLRVVDACRPESFLKDDLLLARSSPRSLWAVFLNYLLDCLPARILDVSTKEVRQLYVRTCLARGVKLEEFTDLTVEELGQYAASDDIVKQREVLKIFGLLASEYEYRCADVGQIAYGEFAVEFARARSDQIVLNHGAIQCLERLLDRIDEEGFVLINDYGHTKFARRDEYEHQRFSHTTAMGVFFPLLHAYFAEAKRCRWFQPSHEDQSIHTRLLSHRPAEQTVTCFYHCFSKAALDELRRPVEKARQLAAAGRLDAAMASYAEALERQPYNWMLVNEVATFLIFSLREVRAGIDMAKTGLGLNPNSHELWNTLGEGLFDCGRIAEARQAYVKALQINTQDVRARGNLARVHEREHDYSSALACIAEALALDGGGFCRERLLSMQAEILKQVSQRHEQERIRMANRVSAVAAQFHSVKEDRRQGIAVDDGKLQPPELRAERSQS